MRQNNSVCFVAEPPWRCARSAIGASQGLVEPGQQFHKIQVNNGLRQPVARKRTVAESPRPTCRGAPALSSIDARK